MDVTITFDEVYALVGTNIPSLEPRPNFKRIQKLRRHFENVLQRLPCPQSVQHGWKGMVMAQNMYALLPVRAIRRRTYASPSWVNRSTHPRSRERNKPQSTAPLHVASITFYRCRTSHVHASLRWTRASTTLSSCPIWQAFAAGMRE